MKAKTQPTEQENIFANHIPDNNSTTKRQTNLKMGKVLEYFPKKIYKWPRNT